MAAGVYGGGELKGEQRGMQRRDQGVLTLSVTSPHSLLPPPEVPESPQIVPLAGVQSLST